MHVIPLNSYFNKVSTDIFIIAMNKYLSGSISGQSLDKQNKGATSIGAEGVVGSSQKFSCLFEV